MKEEENTEAKVSQSAYVTKSYHRAVEWTDRLTSKASCVQIREWTHDQRTCNDLEALEKVFSMTNHQENTNQNHGDTTHYVRTAI